MIFEIEHSGYTDPKLYDPMVQIVEKLNLKPLSHKEHNADYPKNSCWIDVLYDKERNVFVNITVY
ncbi:MAG: hypothetical protein KJ896_01495, partial [Nanoarchaeota archaeon]|nr:hypothetical protein [Nanoarchaeota archaeon]